MDYHHLNLQEGVFNVVLKSIKLYPNHECPYFMSSTPFIIQSTTNCVAENHVFLALLGCQQGQGLDSSNMQP